jgi:cytochrome P450
VPDRSPNPFASFDYQVDEHRRNAEQVWRELRDSPGLATSEEHGGFLIASRFDDVFEVVQDYRTFSSADGIGIPNAHGDSRLIPEEIDPPLQRAYRKVISRFLAPAAIFPLEPQLRSSARGLIDAFAGRSEIDLVDVFARPFPILFMLDYLGLPLADGPMLDTWIKRVLTERGTTQAADATTSFHDYVSFHLDRHRSDPDPDHVIGAIVTGEVDGRALEIEEQVALLSLLIHGGFTTTTFAISGAMKWLADHPAELARLRQDPGLLDTAVEEFVRYTSPAAYLARTVTTDTTVGGCPLQAGDRVLVAYGAANHDPRQFADADSVVLDRAPNPHVGFGVGTHRCIGLHVARLELRVALDELVRRLVEFETDPSRAIEYVSGEVQGMVSLPLRVARYAG